MTTVGIDTHKDTLATCAIDGLGNVRDERNFVNDRTGHATLAAWLTSVDVAMVGVEGSSSFGAPVARFLVAAGFAVREVPPHLSKSRAEPIPASRQERSRRCTGDRPGHRS